MVQALIRSAVRAPDRRRSLTRRITRRLSGGIDWSRSVAYVTSGLEQGVRINLQGREPYGIVPRGEYEQLRERLRAEIAELRDPGTGKPLVKAVYLREELFHGGKADEAPDVVFDFAEGVATPGRPVAGGQHVVPTGWKSGEHDLDGILVAHGPGVPAGRRLENAHLIDIAPTVLHLSDVPIPDDMDGVSLAEALYGAALDPARNEAGRAVEAGVSGYTAEEEQQIEEHLRSLGYLD